jgi:hypothetical protein
MTAPGLGNIRRFFRSYLFQEIHHLEVMHALVDGLPWYVPNPELGSIQVALAEAVFGFDQVRFIADAAPEQSYAELAAYLLHCIKNESMLCFGDQLLQLTNLPESLHAPVWIRPTAVCDTAVLSTAADQDAERGRWILRWRPLYPNSGGVQLFLFDIDNDRVYLTPSLSKTRLFADLLADLTSVLPLQALYEPELRLGRFRAMAG